MPTRFIGTLIFAACLSAALHAQPSSKASCGIVASSPTQGEKALARHDYEGAEAFYRGELEKDHSSHEAQLGLTESLVGLNKITQAFEQAKSMLAEKPADGLGDFAFAEVAYRAANFDDAYQHLKTAERLSPCDGRVKAALARIAAIHGLHATATSLLEVSHRLRPNDELIQREWMSSLPTKQRLAELSRYLHSEHTLSKKTTHSLETEVQHLQAHRPGECRIVSKTDKTTVPFRPISVQYSHTPIAFGLDVSLNGKSRRMQIDSGASGIILTHNAARALNLKPEITLQTFGVGDKGAVDSYLSHVEKIRIGDIEVSNCMVEVLSTSSLPSDGLIGTDVFSNWLVTLEYQKEQMTLSPLPLRPQERQATSLNLSGDEDQAPTDRYIAPEMKDWTRILRIGHQILLPARFGTSQQHYLMADTGASKSSLSLDAAKEAGKIIREYDTRIRGISGEVKEVYSIHNLPLLFDRVLLPGDDYTVFDMTTLSHNIGTEVGGFIGLPTLSRLSITIDYRDNLMKITYDPKHDMQRF